MIQWQKKEQCCLKVLTAVSVEFHSSTLKFKAQLFLCQNNTMVPSKKRRFPQVCLTIYNSGECLSMYHDMGDPPSPNPAEEGEHPHLAFGLNFEIFYELGYRTVLT